MSGIWAYTGPSPPANALDVISHRGHTKTFDCAFNSPAGFLQLQQCDSDSDIASSQERFAPGKKRYSIVFDGRIYNRTEMASDIGEPANPGDTDAELLLTAFTRRGPECLHHINGMFAFIIWDDEAKQLYAGRDRFGLKPLYVYVHPTKVAFASEIKQFFVIPDAKARLHIEGGLDFLISGLTDHRSETMFENVYRLPAGTMLQLDLREWQPRHPLPSFSNWYRLPTPETIEVNEAAAVAQFRALLTDAVCVRWGQLNPVGLCLSGGLDSSSIAGILADERNRSGDGEALLTFKACFCDEEYDETQLLEKVIALTGVVNHRIYCTLQEALELIEPLVWHLDEPFSRASLAAQWMLFAQAAEQGIRSTLDGQGADEQLGGYTSMILEHLASLEDNSGANSIQTSSSRSAWAQTGTVEGESRYSWLSPKWQSVAAQSYTPNPNAPKRSLGQLCRHRMLQGDLPMMMRQNDRIGMAHGIETHVPFMDHRLVEFSISLGDKFKFINNQSKYLLRRAMRGLVPKEVLEQCYKGSYSKLEEGWLRCSKGEQWVQAVMETAREWPELFAEDGVRGLTRDFARADKETLLLLWRILCFGVWARKFEVSS